MKPDAPRRAAFDALRRVHASDGYANLVLPEILQQRQITGRDARFATELLNGTCRWQGSYDAIIAAASGRRLKDFQPAVLDVLRLGTHQALAMEVADHAAVATSVELARAAVGQRVTGLVNAVLRKISARTREEWLDQLAADLTGDAALALRHSHPEWVVAALTEALDDPGEVSALLEADNAAPALSLALRPGLDDSEAVAALRAAGAEPTGRSPWAWRWQGNPAELAPIRAGTVGVQDEGSQLVVLALSRAEAPDGPWLDLCAGPGGKTALLSGLAPDGVLAVEPQHHRARLVAGAVRALPRPALVVAADGTRPAWRPNTFARVLADVPCSGLGALRRRPESRWRRSQADVDDLHPLQLDLLRSALDSAGPGGVVGYATCSPHRHETVDVVEQILSERPDLEVLDAPALLPEVEGAARGRYLQLWPHRHGTDAMFLALLRVRSVAAAR